MTEELKRNFDDEYREKRSEEVLFKKRDIELLNWQILEVAHCVKENLEYHINNKTKLEFSQINSYQGSFYNLKKILEFIDDDFLTIYHQKLKSFYQKELTVTNDILKLEETGEQKT